MPPITGVGAGVIGPTEPVESAATVRAEVTRLRRRLGPDVVLSRPYRLHERVSTDLGDNAEELLPDSRAPGIAQARRNLDATFEVD